jgi:nucleotide-binding universal stress UspA family protein
VRVLASALGGTTTLLHVMQPPRDNFSQGAPDALTWEIARQEAMSYLERLRKEVASQTGQQVGIRVEQGHPAARIRAVAHEVGASVTVLGASGEGGATWTLGTTAQEVLLRAEGSVFIARSPMATAPGFAPRRILVPLDGSLRAESILPTVARIAHASGAEVRLAHVVSEPQPSGILRAPEDLEMARALTRRLELQSKSYLDGICQRLRRDVSSVRTSVSSHGDPGQRLCELAESEGIDLVILSAHGAICNRARALGSVTTHLLRCLIVPVMMLQDLIGTDRLESDDVQVGMERTARMPSSKDGV